MLGFYNIYCTNGNIVHSVPNGDIVINLAVLCEGEVMINLLVCLFVCSKHFFLFTFFS